jgi:CubicO group peptidase (beta-lactamase class C family)
MPNLKSLASRLKPLFDENFTHRGELGAAVSVWHEGKPLVNLHGGFCDAGRERPWNSETLVLVWSATKGIGSACLLHALQENRIDPDRKVSEFWPSFAENGKSGVSIRVLMSHSAGLCALDHAVDILDYENVIRALEMQAPVWEPGTAHGYHARTFGFLIDELIRKISGLSTSEYWRRFFAEPLSLDFWIGLPNELNYRVATIYAAKAGGSPEPAKFYRDLATPGTLQQRTFSSPRGLQSVSAMNKPEIRAQPLVSFGGIGSADALAKFYGMLANDGVMEGQRYFEPDTIRWMSEIVSHGEDRVFEIPTAFSAGFLVDSPARSRAIFGPSGLGFGHPGAGGSHAFADIRNKIGFAYVMNQMEQTVLPTEKSLCLVDALYANREKSF